MCYCVWKFADVVYSFYFVLYKLTFVSISVLWLLIVVAIISNQDPYSKNKNQVKTV